MNAPVVAVIEWLSDKAEDPVAIVADDVDAARLAALRYLSPMLPTPDDEGNIAYIDAAWMAENPLPELDDADAVKAWLDAFHEQTTDAWLTLYGAPGSGHYNTYLDASSPARG